MWNLVHSIRRLSINQVYYVEILKPLCEAVCRRRPELWPNDWILHHDRVPAQQFLVQKLITEMGHPPLFP